MAWVAVNQDGTERIFSDCYKPIRGYYIEHLGEWVGLGVIVPKGTIKKLIGRNLSWEDNPVELDTFGWKDIENWDSYCISTLGDILRKDKNNIIVPISDRDGYLQVRLSHHNKQKTFKVHRLVAQAFIPNPNNYPQVNHKNGIKSDNRVENLEWCDGKYNVNYSHSKIYHDSITHRMKPVIQLSLNGEVIQRFESVRSAAKSVNATNSHISDACNGKYKTCKGYMWKWIEDEPVELKD